MCDLDIALSKSDARSGDRNEKNKFFALCLQLCQPAGYQDQPSGFSTSLAMISAKMIFRLAIDSLRVQEP